MNNIMGRKNFISRVINIRRRWASTANKFRLPDLQLEELSPGTVLTKWYKQEGDIVKEGDILCQIETPNMVLDLDSSKSGFVAEILVPKGSKDIAVGKTLCILVDSKEDIETYATDKQTAQPDGIEAFQALHDETEPVDGADILRLIKTLYQEESFTPEEYSVLKSMARNNDSRLLTTYEGSFDDQANFDRAFFLENARDLVVENK